MAVTFGYKLKESKETNLFGIIYVYPLVLVYFLKMVDTILVHNETCGLQSYHTPAIKQKDNKMSRKKRRWTPSMNAHLPVI